MTLNYDTRSKIIISELIVLFYVGLNGWHKTFIKLVERWLEIKRNFCKLNSIRIY